MIEYIDGVALMKSIKTDLCDHLYCRECSFCTDDGGCKVEEWIDKFPSAEQTEPQTDCPWK